MAWGSRRLSPLLIAAGACTAIATASLALASGPTYDPYSWLIWGRDFAHLQFGSLPSGTSWKPFPSLVAVVLAPLGGGAADAWLVIARAGALFAAVMAFRLAWRIAPAATRPVAGVIAAATLFVAPQWISYSGVGYSEGLMVALGLLAIERHLDGHRRTAFWLIVVASLIRIEAWPFALGYGALIWHRDRSRGAVVAGEVLIPLLWFGGDWLGSGSLTTGAGLARHTRPDWASSAPHPTLTVLSEEWHLLPPAAWLAIVVALVAALVRRRGGLLGTLAAAAVIWTAIVAAMALRGYAGLPRFLFMAVALEAVIAGVGAAVVADALRSRRVPPAAAALAVCAAFAAGSVTSARALPGSLADVDTVADSDAGLVAAVEHAGGTGAVLGCGAPGTPWYTVPALEWNFHAQPGTFISLRHPAARSSRVVFGLHNGTWAIHGRNCPAFSRSATRLARRSGGGAGSRRHARSGERT